MKILVIGAGGREHALVWKIKQSKRVEKIYCAPGNTGISELAECVDIKADDINKLVLFAKENKIDLTVVGPEVPLVLGIVDEFEKHGLKIFGPSKEASQLEGSKVFSKEFLKKYYIPSAEFEAFTDKKNAEVYAEKVGVPIVIKADGLAAGKGVYVCKTEDEVAGALKDIFDDGIFGDAGAEVIIEECLEGEEASILVFSDGEYSLMMEASQDHKRVFDNDEGPNTGGMGAYCPAPVITKELELQIRDEIIIPTIYGMKKDGIPYKGILYAGIMVTKKGPMVLEFNVRFGDPETQVVLPRLENDIIDVMEACIDGTLKQTELSWNYGACVCVVLASKGYPGKYEKGAKIEFDEKLQEKDDIIIFHAGTCKKEEDIVTAGGRVLGVVALGDNIKDTIDKVYKAVDLVKCDNLFYRKDIASKAL